MTKGMSSLGIRNVGLFLIGILLLVIGFAAYTYHYYLGPYQTLGIVLVVAGIVFMAFGFIIRFPADNVQLQETEPQPQ